jgi:CubicO group peptidase (beta-lactamase class C family)
MKRRSLLLALVIVTAACGSNPAEPLLPEDPGVAGDGNLSATLSYVRERFDLPALAGMLIRDGAIVEGAAVGDRALGYPEPVTADDQWHIGSLTKSMTATLAAVLVERSVVDWSTTIGDVFPDLVTSMQIEYTDVRLDELLSHTSGMPADVSQAPIWQQLGSDTDPDERREFTSQLLQLPPVASRGQYLYSNGGYVVAGTMLEEITGEAWEDLMQEAVFDPLGMAHSGFGAPGMAGERSQPWGHWDNVGQWLPVEPGPGDDNPAAIGPAGTVHTTMNDYAAYVIAHLTGARGTDGLVTAATFTKLHTPASDTDYALGWAVTTRPWAGGDVLVHAGSNLRWFAVIWIAPERNFAMLAFTNAGGDRAEAATDAAIQALLLRHDAAFGGAT